MTLEREVDRDGGERGRLAGSGGERHGRDVLSGPSIVFDDLRANGFRSELKAVPHGSKMAQGRWASCHNILAMPSRDVASATKPSLQV